MKSVYRKPLFAIVAGAVIATASLPGTSVAGSSDKQILADYLTSAKTQNPGLEAFSADRGRNLFLSSPASGKPDTPSCTSCHSTDPLNSGRTRAGKDIAPMALSKTPARYTDRKKVEKWFRRNCKSVLGRICTPLEKGDIITFMISQ